MAAECHRQKPLATFFSTWDFYGRKVKSVNQVKLQIFCFTIFAFGICAIAKELPDLTKITPGWQIVDDRGVIYKSSDNRFVWGIVFPSDEEVNSCEFSSTKSTLNSHSFNLQLVNNKLTISSGTKSITIEIKPNTVNLLNTNLTIQSSADISGIQLVPRKQWSRDANDYVTVYDLKFPKDFYNRF
jgi:hypothetical protein